MRPLRLLLDGFGTYRQPADADFSDVDFFALIGPTGSGKSTLIDGLCFALYGTVPRWGKENAIAQALAPSANACRVCLVFEAAGRRYVAVRALSRDAKGRVHTKEARLERLDASIPPDAPIEKILQASVEQLAEGPDQVKAQVQDLLGLTYEHFTQSVLLPQGRFSEFLHAKSRDRQGMLIELLAFGVYEQIGQRARERAKRAAERLQLLTRQRQQLAGATAAARELAAAGLAALTSLAQTVDDRLAALSELKEQAAQAAQQARGVRGEIALLAALRTPAEVPGLAGKIAQADALVAERKKRRDTAEQVEATAQLARAEMADRTLMERTVAAHAERRRLAELLERQEQAQAQRQSAESALTEKLQAAERDADRTRHALADAERADAAAHLAEVLHVGDDCPVCLRAVVALPRHDAPADLLKARKSVETAASAHKRAQAAHAEAAKAAAAARGMAQETGRQLAEFTQALTKAAAEADAVESLAAISQADRALEQARRDAAAGRSQVSAAERARSSLAGAERDAWAALGTSRDPVVGLGAPAIAGDDLAAAWTSLSAWASAQQDERSARQQELDATARGRQRLADDSAAALTSLVTEHGVGGVSDPARAPAVVAAHVARAQEHLAVVRREVKQAAALDRQIAADREEEQVATALGNMLRANSFERWLCTEALDSLVAEASATLMELSGGQYQLDRDDHNELVVIDYEDAGARRPVHTLSGGETFQASLALALALSRQVVGLSAGLRDLNSMFLDEGFGTLDEDTLETVATTLERLAADSDRMVGIVTHVAALADRVPVRFVVSRVGTASTLRKERV
jgi:DNA repair protein SbcC/Rad50